MTETIRKGEQAPLRQPVGEEPGRRLLSREEYHRAAELGIFGPDERLELIHGDVYRKMSPQTGAHAMAVRAIATALEESFGEGVDIRSQLPLHADESEPEPDVAVVPGSWRDYKEHPAIGDAMLVVEIADTSLRVDRGVKAALYAEAGVKEYWILNLKSNLLEVYREPAAIPDAPHGFGFRSTTLYTAEHTVSPLAKPEAVLAVARLLPAL